MIASVQQTMPATLQSEFLLVAVCCNPTKALAYQFPVPVRILSASSIPAAKNKAVKEAAGELLLFLLPGIFSTSGAIQRLVDVVQRSEGPAAATGRWCNAAGKLEIGYNVRRFPTIRALLLDILLLNKVFPRNRSTRQYKMHDFDHQQFVDVEHANDSVFIVTRRAVETCGGFNEEYAPGWFDQVEFCQSMRKHGLRVVFEPTAAFVSNGRPPLIGRLVRDQYAEYRRAEYSYIRNHLPLYAGVARAAIIIGMIVRMGFSIALPDRVRKWFLIRLRSYVNDAYVRSLRGAYWRVLKSALKGAL